MAKIVGPVEEPEVEGLLREVMDNHHPELAAEGVTVALFWASDTKGGPALKHHGYPALAVVRINSDVKLRLRGMPDASITIDKERWERLTSRQQEALLDHELEHLKIRRDRKSGAMKVDDAGRPILEMQGHDFELGIFDCIVARHGRDCVDAQVLKAAGVRPITYSERVDDEDPGEVLDRIDAHQGDRNVGYLTSHPASEGDGIWLKGLRVSPRARRQGIASELMRLALAKYGDRPVRLRARPYGGAPLSREQLAGWYGRFGFEPYDEEGRMVRWPPRKSADAEDRRPYRDRVEMYGVDPRGRVLGDVPEDTSSEERRRLLMEIAGHLPKEHFKAAGVRVAQLPLPFSVSA